MDDPIILLLSAIISILILYIIIRNASGADTRKKQLRLQNQILLHIAKKLEVDQEKLDKLQEDNFKY